MSILDTIIDMKRDEVERSRSRLPLHIVADLARAADPPRGFAKALAHSTGSPRVIAEVKRASPSKGVLRPADPPGAWRPEALARAYEWGGAAALSVLTDVHFFWGHPDALGACRQATSLPCLRKDFIVDAYQVDESRLLGADAILLIARALSAPELSALAARAGELGMDVLLEVHDERELDKALAVSAGPLEPEASRAAAGGNVIIGINNRDLATMDVDIDRAGRMRRLIPSERLVVGESGLEHPADLHRLTEQGVDAFLIGERLARHDDPRAELQRLLGSAP